MNVDVDHDAIQHHDHDVVHDVDVDVFFLVKMLMLM